MDAYVFHIVFPFTLFGLSVRWNQRGVKENSVRSFVRKLEGKKHINAYIDRVQENSIVKPTRCTSVSNLFYVEWHCTCFGRSFRPSSGVQDCTYSNRYMSNRYCRLQQQVYVKQILPTTATVIRQTDTADCLLASRRQYLFDWRVYSPELLMMDGKTVRNMYNVIPHKIIGFTVAIYYDAWLYERQKSTGNFFTSHSVSSFPGGASLLWSY